MKKFYLQLTFCLLAFTALGQTTASKTTAAIIPQPVSLTVNSGQFLLPQNVIIAASSHPELKQTLAF
jgi:hexosaminidase